MKKFLVLFSLVLSLGASAQTSYFVDNLSGKDTNKGTSVYEPWKTIARVNQMKFKAGDSLLFRRGGSWVGNLKPQGSGVAGRHFVIGAYGRGPSPEIDAKGIVANGERVSVTIRLLNQEYIEIRDLKIKNFLAFEKPRKLEGKGNTSFVNSEKMGIYVEGKDCGTLHHIYLVNLEVCEVNGDMSTKDNGGIYIEITGNEDPSKRIKSNFEGLYLEGCSVHDVDRTGWSNSSIWWDRSLNSHRGDTLANGKIHNWIPSRQVVIRNNKFERTGANALIVRAADYPIIEYNLFSHCAVKGSGNASFPFNCDHALFQYNEACYTVYNSEADSWDNKKDADAGGFDSDWNCKETIIQYNYSHDNGFGGVLICRDGGSKNSFNDGTVIRYNVFENNGDHMIRLSGPVTNSKIYNNLFYSGADQDSVMFVFHKSWGGYSDSTLYQNNLFIARGKGCYFDTGKSTRNFFHANLYQGAYSNKPSDPEGIESNPMFLGENGKTGLNPWLRYLLLPNSPAIHSGLPMMKNRGRDFTGNSINAQPSRGPFEFH